MIRKGGNFNIDKCWYLYMGTGNGGRSGVLIWLINVVNHVYERGVTGRLREGN